MSNCVSQIFLRTSPGQVQGVLRLRYPIYPIEADDLAEFVEFPDVVAVGAELPELEALLALGLVAVRAHAAGVVVAACMLEARYLQIL